MQTKTTAKQRQTELLTLRTVVVVRPPQPDATTAPLSVEPPVEENMTKPPAEVTTTASVASTGTGKGSKGTHGKKRKTEARNKQRKRGKESHRIDTGANAKQRRQ